MTASARGSQYFGKDLEAMSFAVNYHRWILDCFRPYLGDIVAEVGAGRGSFSRLLLDVPIRRLVAFEPSTNMYAELSSTLSADSRAVAVNDFFDPARRGERFDTVVYVNVLEHIEDDAAELTAAHSALGPGGHLLIFVPALAWLFSPLDRQVGHFRRYHMKDLLRLVGGAGFKRVHARYFDIAGIVPWYVNFVLLRNSIGSASVSAYDKLVVPLMRRVESRVPPCIGKNILLVAEKP